MECKRFLGAAETRASSVLAGWDTWRPRDVGGHGKPSSLASRECELCRLARVEAALRSQKRDRENAIVATAASIGEPVVAVAERHEPTAVVAPAADTRESVAFDLIDVVDDADLGLGYELNFLADGINPVPVDSRAEPSRISAPAAITSDAIDTEKLDLICGDLIRSVRCAAANLAPAVAVTESIAPSPVPTAVAEVASPASEQVDLIIIKDASPSLEWSAGYGPDLFAAIDDQLARFDRDQLPVTNDVITAASTVLAHERITADGSPTVATEAPAIRQPLPTIPWPVFAADTSIGNCESTQVTRAEIPWPVFAPAAQPEPNDAPLVASNEDGAAIFERVISLTRIEMIAQTVIASSNSPDRRKNEMAAKPLETPGTAGLHTSRDVGSSQSNWGNAVQLTREAMVAWMKVLAGPAVVQMSAR